jgi:spore germination protein KA
MFWNRLFRKQSGWKKRQPQGQQPQGQQDIPLQRVSKSLHANLSFIRELFGDSSDIKINEFYFGKNRERKGALIYLDGLVNPQSITQSILKPLRSFTETDLDSMEQIEKKVLCAANANEYESLSELIGSCLCGDTIFLAEGFDRGLLIGTRGWEQRSITEPETEVVVHGPREGFTENLLINTMLLRRRIKSPRLRLEQLVIGQKTRTKVCIAYIEGVAGTQLIAAVKRRLAAIDVDAILDSGYLEQYIEDAPYSIFGTVGNTEKPDVATAKMLEGRVVIISDGSPFALTVPYLFVESFQNAEDYYVCYLFSSIIRQLRYLSFFITIFAPAWYIALTTFHQELIPTTLLFTIAKASRGIPFPAFTETLILFVTFEIVREAGLRLPRPVGQAVSIVGALVLGEAAINAGFVGAPGVIVLAITAVSSFVVPEKYATAAILRMLAMIGAGILGGFGITVIFLGILIHLATLKSFGVPFFEGFTPSTDLKDSFIRLPLWLMARRPKDIAQGDHRRSRVFIPPLRPYAEAEDDDI